MSSYKEVIIDTNTKGADIIADAFFSIGCDGVKIIDKADLLEVQKDSTLYDYIDEKLFTQSDIVKVSGFIAEEDLPHKLSALKNILSNYDFVEDITILDCDIDWYNNWRQYYQPIEIGNFVIVPKWTRYDNADNKTIITINPGMAFGTGQHQSTQLSLQLMSTINMQDKRVIDIGTGSGILAISALKSQAKSCYMCDIDSLAIKMARQNLILNNAEKNAILENIDLSEKPPQQADIILANLTADILIDLSDTISRNLVNGGTLICSGIIKDRHNEVIELYKSKGFTKIKSIFADDWSAVLFRSR